MKTSLKIFYLWFATIVLFALSLLFLPHTPVHPASFLNNAVQVLLFYISLFIFLKETNRKKKILFFNFMVFFSLSFYAHIHNFVGTVLFTGNVYANFISYEYHVAAFIFTLSFAIIYLVIDLLFFNSKTIVKYLVASTIVLFFFVWYFFPFFTNPLYLYTTEDISQWKTLVAYTDAHHESVNSDDLAKMVHLQAWKGGAPVGDLYPDENFKRIDELEPYLEGDNYRVLLMKPLFLNMVYMNVMVLFFMMLFFGYQYEKDPPQGAYIDKIMFTLLLFCSTEILHFWGYIKSIEWNLYVGLFDAGQYITIAMLLMLVVFFSLRLRFITSVTGEFYETELASNPQHVTRWRDGIDNIVLTKFFNLNPLRMKLFHSNTQQK
jgi:hypothetical protein